MLWLEGWSIIAFMQQKNILSERAIMKAFWDSKHGIFVCFKRFYTAEEPVPVRCRSAFRNYILLANSSIFFGPSCTENSWLDSKILSNSKMRAG